MTRISGDFRRTDGMVKPMHGVGNAPLLGTDDKLFHFLGEAGIPFSRLHDTGGRYGGGCFVDIPNVFRNWDADPDREDSYDFAFTDWLLTALHRQGVEPFYRLGVTIENSWSIKAYHIFPPADPLKWARVCAGVIRHYNEGWANGYHFGIRYWEIWNEPDNEPDPARNPMWQGTKEDYFRLYETTSNYLKSRFPSLRIGGYAGCGFYALSEADYAAVAKSSTRTGYFVEFFHEFLRYISSPAHKSPLDFFSWHSYAGVPETAAYARYARDTLDSYGFTHTENILNEWNRGPGLRGTARDAAEIAAMFCAMQAGRVDLCVYYDGQVNTAYGGLFNPLTEDVFPAYYAFRAFNELYKRREYVRLVSEDGVYAAGATDGRTAAALLANSGDTPAEVSLEWRGLPGGHARWRAVDERYEQPGEAFPLQAGGLSRAVTLPPGAAVLLETL